MNEDERRIRLRTNLVILTPGDRGYQDWQDKRILLALLDEARAPGIDPAFIAALLVRRPQAIGRARIQPAEAERIAGALAEGLTKGDDR